MADNLDTLYEKGLDGFRSEFYPGEKVDGTVTAVSRDCVFVDINAKSEGIIPRVDLQKDGELTVAVGDIVSAYYVHTRDGEIELTVRVSGNSSTVEQAIVDAYAAGIPIEGRVDSERKGGFVIKIGSTEAFCPYSQIDIFGAGDSASHVGQRYTFVITECTDDNLVLSRRQFLEREHANQRQQLEGSLSEGDVVGGVVRRVLDFGAFVDIGGVEGLVPVRELSWARVQHPSDVVKAGDNVTVKVLRLNWEENRFSLSLRQAAGDPWDGVAERFHVSKMYRGVVVRLFDFGAFVQLEPGVDGLIHISKLGAGKRLTHASEVLNEDQEIDVYIESIDLDRKRIALVLENVQQGRTMEVDGTPLTVGETVSGCVEDIKQFGVFIRLNAQKTGLLHISEIPFEGSVNRMRAMWDRFPKGSDVDVVIKSIHNDRVSLALPGDMQNSDDDDFREFLREDDGDGLGSLGAALDGLAL